ncbi:MAG: leucine-rich repeat domain-containing protein [Bacteroidales bacterium]|nr:leucine-rich repeat domain-containing protein [Bacteroidales bacterium]
MKKQIKRFLLIALATVLSANVFAYDFTAGGIYYKINPDDTTVSVTYQNMNYNSYSGSVTIPSIVTYNGTTYSITSIDSAAFHGCTGLTSVTIPNSVTSIGGAAFYNCTGLTSVTIPNSVTSIGYSAFSGCTGLTSITIPNSVTSIGGAAFYNCTGLTSITIPNSVTSIGSSTFSGCTGLTSVTIGNSVTSIGSSAFYGCKGLTSITIPNSVTNIEDSAFRNCSHLNCVKIGNGIESIGENAFDSCRYVDTIYCMARFAPIIYDNTFATINRAVTVYVPCGRVNYYTGENYWNEFSNIQERCDIDGFESEINDSGIKDIKEESESIPIYPNPTKENITLSADEDIFIYNSLGRLVKQISNPKGEITISISDLPKGVYYIKAGNRKQKLIKE